MDALPQSGISLFGVGLYTPTEAARLIGVPAAKLVRWLRGHGVEGRRYDALWPRQIDIGDEQLLLGFRDLVQAKVAATLVGHGLSAQRVRRAISLASHLLAADHPFAHARFRTDGKTILLESLHPGEDDTLIDLFKGGQYVMRSIIEPSLRGIEFADDIAARWWPAWKSNGIVLDPTRQFGQPIHDESGVPTRVLARAVVGEGSIERAARAYGVTVSSIRRAAAFETRLAA